MPPRIRMTLGVFHYRVVRRLTGRNPRRVMEGTWVYPPLSEVMAEAGIQEVETYVARCQKTSVQYITTRPVMGLCLVAEKRLGERVSD